MITSLQDAKRLIEVIRAGHEIVAVDTESDGKEPKTAKIIGISVSNEVGSGYYIVIRKWNVETGILEYVFTEDEEAEILEAFLDVLSTKKLVMHNAPYDVPIIERNYGVDLTWALHADTIMMKHRIDEERPFGLKELATKYARFIGIPYDEIAKQEQMDLKESVKANGGKLTKEEYELYKGNPRIIGLYACADTDYTLRLFYYFQSQLEKLNRLDAFYKKEDMPLMKYTTIPIKMQGVKVDVPYFEQLEIEFQKEADQLESEIHELLAEEMSIYEYHTIDTTVNVRRTGDFAIEGMNYFNLPVPLSKDGKATMAKPAVKKIAKTYSSVFLDWLLWDVKEGKPEPDLSSEAIHEIKANVYRRKNPDAAFNIRSNQNLCWLLYEHLKVPIDSTKTSKKTGKPSVDESVLEANLELKGLKELLALRKVEKQLSTYIKPILAKHIDGWIYPDLLQFGTTSGRYAGGGGLNMQTLPRFDYPTECPDKGCKSKLAKIVPFTPGKLRSQCPACNKSYLISDGAAVKRGFIAPEGYVVVAADYSALEPRIFSAVCQEPGLIEIFVKELDFYSKIAIDVYKLTGLSAKEGDENFLKKKKPELRQSTKTFALSVPYGANAYRLAMESGRPVAEHQKEIDDYLDAYPQLKKYMRDQEKMAYEKGYVVTQFGRVRHLPKAKQLYEEHGKDIFNKFKMALKYSGPEGEELYSEYMDLKAEAYHPDMQDDSLSEEKEKLQKAMDKIRKKIENLGSDGIYKYGVFRNCMNNAKNSPIQMTAAQVTNAAAINFCSSLLREDLDAWMCLNVHDEIIAIARKDQADRVAVLLKECMEKNWVTKKIPLPIIAEPVIGNNFAECK